MTTTSEYIYNDLADEELKTFGPWLKDMLKTGPVSVTFTKKDGNERVMECTLNPKLLPPAVVVTEDAEPKRKKAINDNTMAVYDLEMQAWRSFTLKSVKRVSFAF